MEADKLVGSLLPYTEILESVGHWWRKLLRIPTQRRISDPMRGDPHKTTTDHPYYLDHPAVQNSDSERKQL